MSEFGEGEPLPKGWRRVRLGELLAEAQPGFASSARSDDGVVQLRMNNVRTDGRLDWSSVLRVPTDADQIAFYALRPGDIVFNNTNSVELVGKSALVPLLKEPIVYSNHFTRLRCNPHAEPRFIARWLQSAWRRKVFEQGCDRWLGQAGYQRKKLLALELPIPSPVEQRRIADLLDLQSAEIERAREAALAQLAAIDALAGALLAAAFRGDL